MQTTIFGKTIDLKSHNCSLNGCEMVPITEPYINLYVQLNGCNANCSFCEFKNVANAFDFEKFEQTLISLKEEIEVKKISITGGEPTLELKKLYKIIDLIRFYFPETFLVMNTNGFQLLNLFENGEINNFDSISISRHHYEDVKNNEILGFKALSTVELKRAQEKLINKNLLHLSCNLIKNNIDSEKEIYEFLEFANFLKIYDVGFVSLMKINDFCKENFIDFSSFDFKTKRMLLSKQWNYFDSCKCNNYLYIPEKLDIEVVKAYSRCVLKPEHPSNLVVFNGKNLKFGFNGLTLI